MNKYCSDQSERVIVTELGQDINNVSRLHVCAECTSQFESYISQYRTREKQCDTM